MYVCVNVCVSCCRPVGDDIFNQPVTVFPSMFCCVGFALTGVVVQTLQDGNLKSVTQTQLSPLCCRLGCINCFSADYLKESEAFLSNETVQIPPDIAILFSIITRKQNRNIF